MTVAPFAAAPSSSRRSFVRLVGALAGAALLPSAARAQSPSGASTGAAPATPSPFAPSATLSDAAIELDSNENPYGPPASAIAAIVAALPRAARYSDEADEQLATAVATLHGVERTQVALGAGSSQILHAVANAFAGANAPAVVAEPTFEAFARYATHRGAAVTRVPLTADYRHDLAAMARAAGERGVLYLCNPNNPTASVTPASDVRALVEGLPSTVTVLVDEAYHDYAVGEPGYESVVPWIARHPNLVVARTFSKIYGLAGLRCGYALGAPEAIAAIGRQLPWDSSNLVALVAARAALSDAAFVEDARRRNRELRSSTASALAGLGARVAPSAANFLFADLGADVKPTIEALRADGVRVGRRFAALPTHLRVTIGTEEEMRRFLAAFARLPRVAAAA